MKKVIYVVLFFIIFNCGVKIKEADAGKGALGIGGRIIVESYIDYESQMEYLVFRADAGGFRTESLFIINLTKDKLEVELLRKKLNDVNKQKSTKKKGSEPLKRYPYNKVSD